jgi:hypothetical protein
MHDAGESEREGPECDGAQIVECWSSTAMASSTSASALSSSSFDAYNNTLQASALKAVRAAATSLPADIDFHRTVDGDYAADLDACAERVLALTNQLLGLASTANASRSSRNKGKGRMLEDQDDVVDRFHSVVVDSMDQMLERAVRDAYCRLPVGLKGNLYPGHCARHIPGPVEAVRCRREPCCSGNQGREAR